MFEIIPLACSTVNWATFLTFGKELTGKSISITVDKYGLKQDLGGYLASISEFLTRSVKDPATTFEEACGMLRHIHVSFLVIAFDEFFRGIREETDLAISTTSVQAGHKAAIISGNLQQWQQSIINCSSARMSSEVRALSNKFMAQFEMSGLGLLWQDYSKSPMPDKTLKLLIK